MMNLFEIVMSYEIDNICFVTLDIKKRGVVNGKIRTNPNNLNWQKIKSIGSMCKHQPNLDVLFFFFFSNHSKISKFSVPN